MLRTSVRVAALAAALVLAAPGARAAGVEADPRAERLVRVEVPLWRRVLAGPALVLRAFHWPLRRLLFWGEDVRIDRRLRDAVLGRDNDDLPIPEPAADDEGEHVWWDWYRSTVLVPLERAVDPGEAVPAVGRAVGLAAPAEAANPNALDEVPDSTWFTNRVGRPDAAPAPAEEPDAEGPLLVESAHFGHDQPGVWVRDGRGRRFLLRFDHRDHPGLATAAELVSARLLHALGWNVAGYAPIVLDPRRLALAPGAKLRDRYGDERPLAGADVARVLAAAARESDGTFRALASRRVPGVPKGGFRMTGVRGDDPNDTVPHEDRRDLRGLRVAAAWLDHVDFRSGNTLDSFVRREGDPPAHGRLVHWLVDLNGTLGCWHGAPKPRWMGRRFAFHPISALGDAVGLGPPWRERPVVHPALGTLDAEAFEPESWRPIYPAAPFERATLRDALWGARLVVSLPEAEIRAAVAAPRWRDPAAAGHLLEILLARRRRIAEVYLDGERASPLAAPRIEAGRLSLRDLGVESGVADAGSTRHRLRAAGEAGEERSEPRWRLAEIGDAGVVEIETRRGDGPWSPPIRLRIATTGGRPRIAAIEREVR